MLFIGWTMEVRIRFGRDHSANLPPTFFQQCILLHTLYSLLPSAGPREWRHLVTTQSLGLLPFVQQREPTTTWAEGMHGHLIQFRYHTNDAVELDHVCHGGNKAHHPFGYQALCAAQRAVAKASSIIMYTSSDSEICAS